MDNVKPAELEEKYLLWLATGIAFYRNVEDHELQVKIKDLVIDDNGVLSQAIPASMAEHSDNIKLYARHVRYSLWCFDHAEELKDTVKKYEDYTLEDFISFYNKWVQKRKKDAADTRAS